MYGVSFADWVNSLKPKLRAYFSFLFFVSRVMDGLIWLFTDAKGMCIQQRGASHPPPRLTWTAHISCLIMKTAASHACKRALHMLVSPAFSLLLPLFFHLSFFLSFLSFYLLLLLLLVLFLWFFLKHRAAACPNPWRLIYESAAPL